MEASQSSVASMAGGTTTHKVGCTVLHVPTRGNTRCIGRHVSHGDGPATLACTLMADISKDSIAVWHAVSDVECGHCSGTATRAQDGEPYKGHQPSWFTEHVMAALLHQGIRPTDIQLAVQIHLCIFSSTIETSDGAQLDSLNRTPSSGVLADSCVALRTQ